MTRTCSGLLCPAWDGLRYLMRIGRHYEGRFDHDGRSFDAGTNRLCVLRGVLCFSSHFFRDGGVMTPARIRAIRDKLGLTNAQLAATCGVSVQTVYGWLKPATCRKHGPPNVSARVLLELLERRAGNGTKKTDA